ncbi:MAG: IS66 family transposase [Gammaproteobacteria bacterium]
MQEENAALKAEKARLEAELAKARKNSGNSSKPPSSDIVKPPRPKPKDGKGQAKQGAQPGHARHERPPFEPSQINDTIDYTLSGCPHCGGPVERSDEPPRIVQQVEMVVQPIEVIEHRGQAYWCPKCQQTHYATIDEAVRKAGLIGPGLTALIAYLKGACHCSFSTIRKFLRDVVGLSISRGQLAKLIHKVSDSLQDTYELLLELLPKQQVVNSDETGHKDKGDAMWTWCFRAPLFTLFKISPSRGADVLLDVLGQEFDGVLGCDYFSAYRKYMKDCNVLVQFCLAHLIRDIKFLTTHPDPRNRTYGQRVLEAARALFALIHRREQLDPKRFALDLEDAGNELCGAALYRVPSTKEANNLAQRFEKHGDSYIRFITTPGIEPTNNLAEQAIRFVVLDRHVTQGSRGETGQRWLERIWTVIATCTQQGRSVFSFLYDSVTAFFNGSPAPTLAPNSS